MKDWLKELHTGDRVTRLLAGVIPMEMEIVEIKDGLLICAAVQEDGSLFMGEWSFCQQTGGEVDPDLGWFPPLTPTGSVLVKQEKK
jgi:hypothetical protein